MIVVIVYYFLFWVNCLLGYYLGLIQWLVFERGE